MSKRLFSEFDSVSAKQWKQKIQFDLKGADYNQALVWKTNDDISVKPFYHSDDFDEPPMPSKTKAKEWNICETIFVANVKNSNLKAQESLSRGAESIKFIIPSEDISIKLLLENIDVSSTPIYFELQFLSPDFVKKIASFSEKGKIYINSDIIGNIAKNGNWFKNLNIDFSKFETIVNLTQLFSIDTCLYQNAGAITVQQLAYGLAHANEYLNRLDNEQSFNAIFNVSIGTNYFFEIAKIRALRLLWHTLAAEYQMNTECQIFATPTKRNKTLYDHNTNMLRTTTECMSAILGGANTISNLPYDTLYRKRNEFGDRIARNQLLILKHESYFNKVNNPADGAYYIESITHQLAEKALELFKNIETNGGFLNQLKDGTIQRKIKESANKEQEQFNTGKEVLLGSNKYPNEKDKMNDQLELYPFLKTNKRKTLIEPILEKRLSENLEQQRLKNEN
ncbi:methylmalonyl-CoA mutase subunit beta [Seonamhaeicola aphaedonensis]|uniref:Heterodimeric methylmalonyl-CoA mutase small subunit n=1 Tax=Seonamhaeicola aphaedonensis TaxID=1461338 RepID=A0A3D9HE58_9FLAO|nr:methylmalonyl-CoA mutase subunit beta [Seonamhaeicola aphaedonensis]RED47541.1 heterodimeric methylmalonyl-CoA mutase small subunit [Seonamhaeicola aphaedonensis]